MYERILVPLDGSEVGEAALPYVEELVSKLAPNTKVEVTLLQVITMLTHHVTIDASVVRVVLYTGKELEQIRNEAKDYLHRVGERLRSKGITVKAKVSTGHAAEEIIKAAKETEAGLIAMSTHGRSGVRRWALGSVTDKVLQEGTIPVLTVRPPKG